MAYPNNFCVTTAYKGPTNSRGSRIEAKCQGGRHTRAYDAELSAVENHEQTARELASYMGHPSEPIGAQLPDYDNYAWIFPKTNAEHPADCLCSRCTGAIGGN
jgi:hypothetical protein